MVGYEEAGLVDASFLRFATDKGVEGLSSSPIRISRSTPVEEYHLLSAFRVRRRRRMPPPAFSDDADIHRVAGGHSPIHCISLLITWKK